MCMCVGCLCCAYLQPSRMMGRRNNAPFDCASAVPGCSAATGAGKRPINRVCVDGCLGGGGGDVTGDAGQFSFTLDPSTALTTPFHTEASWPLRAPMGVFRPQHKACGCVCVYVCMLVRFTLQIAEGGLGMYARTRVHSKNILSFIVGVWRLGWLPRCCLLGLASIVMVHVH